MSKIVLVTGGFDPIHSGHISYLSQAKKLGDRLVVGLNSDDWLARKKGKAFLPYEERVAIVEALEMVDWIIKFDDSDNSAINAIDKILSDTMDTVVFANGGDRNNENTPEFLKYQNHPDVEFVFGVGGDKTNSSSWILDEWKTQKTLRDWGYWRVLDDKGTVKVKELVINPGCSLSDQRHYHRSEHWYILEGSMKMDIERGDIISTNVGRDETIILKQHQTYIIHREDWHKAYNPFDKPCHILEVQYGTKCIEEDIERR